MPTNWVDVASDAVKIGLGVLISGVSGWAVLRANQRHERLKEQQARIREEFRTIEVHLNQTWNTVHQQTSNALAYFGVHELTLDPDQIYNLEQDLVRSIDVPQHIASDLCQIDSKLQLMGYAEASKRCREFYDAIRVFQMVARGTKTRNESSCNEISALILKMNTKRDALYHALSVIYRSVFH